MKKILVPTDYSDCANFAAEVAKEIALKSNAELYFLHLEEVVPEVVHVLQHTDRLHEPKVGKARYQLQQQAEQAEREGLTAHAIFVGSDREEHIEDYVKSYDIDFVVMGSHGASGIREAFLGSKTQKVIRHVQVPVLVIKKPWEGPFSPERIVFASTFREDVTTQLKQVVNFAKLWNAKVDLVFINLLNHLIDEFEAQKQMRIQMKEAGITGCTLNVSETNDEEFGIMKFAESIDADVIAVVLDTPTGITSLFSSSVAEKLVNHSQIPILVMNPE
jgi:nucleotide-binding universal stress UspA family protein